MLSMQTAQRSTDRHPLPLGKLDKCYVKPQSMEKGKCSNRKTLVKKPNQTNSQKHRGRSYGVNSSRRA